MKVAGAGSFWLRESGLYRRVTGGFDTLARRYESGPSPVLRMPQIRHSELLSAACAFLLFAVAQGCASSHPVTDGAKQQGAPRVGRDGVPENCCGDLERDIIDELNRARTNPDRYATSLEGDLRYYRGNLFRRPEDESALQTREGTAAAVEAIRVLRKTKPLSALRPSNGLTLGARDHVRDQAPRGLMNHKGTDGTMAWDRVSRYGQWQTKVSENMTFGPASARDVITALLIDDGIRDRGHRKNILDPEIRIVGVSCAPHKTYRLMCDIVHAGGFTDRVGTAAGK